MPIVSRVPESGPDVVWRVAFQDFLEIGGFGFENIEIVRVTRQSVWYRKLW